MLGYVHTMPDKFENATFFIRMGSSVHDKKAFSVTENGTFWKRSPKWIDLKTPARCVSVDGKNGTFWKRLRPGCNLFENDYEDGEHFIRFRDKNFVFKFIRLSVEEWLQDNNETQKI